MSSLLLKCTNISDQRSTAGPQKAVSNYNGFVHSEMLTYFKVSLRVETPEAQNNTPNPQFLHVCVCVYTLYPVEYCS